MTVGMPAGLADQDTCSANPAYPLLPFLSRSDGSDASNDALFSSDSALIHRLPMHYLTKLAKELGLKGPNKRLRGPGLRGLLQRHLTSQRTFTFSKRDRVREAFVRAVGVWVRLTNPFVALCRNVFRLFFLNSVEGGDALDGSVTILLENIGKASFFKPNPKVLQSKATIFPTREVFEAYRHALELLGSLEYILNEDTSAGGKKRQGKQASLMAGKRKKRKRSKNEEWIDPATRAPKVVAWANAVCCLMEARVRLEMELAVECSSLLRTDIPGLGPSLPVSQPRTVTTQISCKTAPFNESGSSNISSTLPLPAGQADYHMPHSDPGFKNIPGAGGFCPAVEHYSKLQLPPSLPPPYAPSAKFLSLPSQKPSCASAHAPGTDWTGKTGNQKHILQSRMGAEDKQAMPPERAEDGFVHQLRAGWVYARCMHTGHRALERLGRHREAIDVLVRLLSLPFCRHSRGVWWNRLSILLATHLKLPRKALAACCRGLDDPWCRTGERAELRRRALRLWKRQQRKGAMVGRGRWAKALAEEQKQHEQCVPHIVVRGRPTNRNIGEKSRFPDFEEGDSVTVEAFALQWYGRPAQGGWSGEHVENGLLRTLFGLLFWDIILDDTVPHVFHHPFQSAPLDLYTDSFYPARHAAIDARLERIRQACHCSKWQLQRTNTRKAACYPDHHPSKVDFDSQPRAPHLSGNAGNCPHPDAPQLPSTGHPDAPHLPNGNSYEPLALTPRQKNAIGTQQNAQQKTEQFRSRHVVCGCTLRKLVADAWKHRGTRCCGVQWEQWSLKHLQDLAVGFGGQALSVIFEAMAKDYRHWCGGLPDLTLWRCIKNTALKPESQVVLSQLPSSSASSASSSSSSSSSSLPTSPPSPLPVWPPPSSSSPTSSSPSSSSPATSPPPAGPPSSSVLLSSSSSSSSSSPSSSLSRTDVGGVLETRVVDDVAIEVDDNDKDGDAVVVVDVDVGVEVVVDVDVAGTGTVAVGRDTNSDTNRINQSDGNNHDGKQKCSNKKKTERSASWKPRGVMWEVVGGVMCGATRTRAGKRPRQSATKRQPNSERRAKNSRADSLNQESGKRVRKKTSKLKLRRSRRRAPGGVIQIDIGARDGEATSEGAVLEAREGEPAARRAIHGQPQAKTRQIERSTPKLASAPGKSPVAVRESPEADAPRLKPQTMPEPDAEGQGGVHTKAFVDAHCQREANTTPSTKLEKEVGSQPTDISAVNKHPATANLETEHANQSLAQSHTLEAAEEKDGNEKGEAEEEVFLEVMMVEVKGPRDRLSAQQRAWLALLRTVVQVQVLRVDEEQGAEDDAGAMIQ